MTIQFQLTNEQKMMQDLAREFSSNEIVPVAAHYDETHEFAWPLMRKAQALGLTTLNVPEKFGGLGLSLLEECLILEEIGWGCSGFSTAMGSSTLAILPILIAGTDAQKDTYGHRLAAGELAAYCLTEPEAGSNVMGIRTAAVRDGDSYILNGSKTFITSATVADFYTVFAYTERAKGHHGISCFVVDRSADGISVGKPFQKMGQHTSDTAEVIFDNVQIPASQRIGEEGEGFLIGMKVFDRSRPTVAAAATGVARRAFDESVRYARERRVGDRPIWQHQSIGHMIADMAIEVEAARALVWNAAAAFDRGDKNTMLAAYAKTFAGDTAVRVTTNAVQVFGGYGYMAEYPVEKLMRDAKIFQIYEGTNQIQRNIIVRELFRQK